MNDQEHKIIVLLLNEMAFEGAYKHFQEPFPPISEEILADIEAIELPKKFDRNTGTYSYVDVNFEPDTTVYEKCYKYLRVIRNNIIHANKAYMPDTPERLADLLDWAHRFIAAVYATDSTFSNRAQEIKVVMRIESF